MLENNHTIHLTLNGESRAFTVEPQETLLHVLRERAHLTGAKKGCDLGECGACTVIMDGRAVNSCCVFAIEADGSTVETIEGIGTADEPHPLQQLLYEKHGLCFVTTVFEICPAYVYCDGEICIRYNKTVEGTVILISLLLLKKQNKNVTLRE